MQNYVKCLAISILLAFMSLLVINGTQAAGSYSDSDMDGIPNSMDSTPNGGLDSDADGIPNSMDSTPYGQSGMQGAGASPGYGPAAAPPPMAGPAPAPAPAPSGGYTPSSGGDGSSSATALFGALGQGFSAKVSADADVQKTQLTTSATTAQAAGMENYQIKSQQMSNQTQLQQQAMANQN